MITGINIYDTVDYVSKFDPEKTNPTVFKIGFFDVKIKNWISDKTSDFEFSSKNPEDKAKVVFRVKERNLELVRFGLKGMVNFLDPHTKEPVKFSEVAVSMFNKSYNVVSDSILNMLPPKVIDELADVILGETELSEEEVKN